LRDLSEADDTTVGVVPGAQGVYLAVVVALVSALRQGPTPARMAVLKQHWGVPEQTVARWQAWWGEAFARSPFWRQARFAACQNRPMPARE
jgi:hypothetical protein